MLVAHTFSLVQLHPPVLLRPHGRVMLQPSPAPQKTHQIS